MKVFSEQLYIVLLLICCITARGQIEITFPAERAVFQRNNGNASIVYISGHYRSLVDRIDARFIPIQGGTEVDWSTIANFPNFGYFRGSLVVNGGWYRLEVRGLRNGEVLFQSQVSKVGVGEVFVIAGQSNAQGYNNYGQKGASDDRVSVINNHYSLGNANTPYPSFGQLEAESKIAPTGNGAWCWGELGDMLTRRLNVPVLFINTAWEGYEVAQFVRSSNGEGGINPYSQIVAAPGYPFNSMSGALHHYTNMTGIRGILWHQGETDNYLKTPRNTYFDQLKTLIQQSRSVTGKNLSWVVSRVSKNQSGYYPTVVDAQNAVVESTENVFYGPNTDEINDRSDGVHFSVPGLNKLAQAWDSSLDQYFFTYSYPQLGNPPLQLSLNCDPDGNASKPIIIRAPQGYASYQWDNGTNSESTRLGEGFYQGNAKDRFGNVYYTAPYKVPNNVLPEKPNITAMGSTQFCEGESVELRASKESDIYWNVNKSGQSIRASSPGIYKATYVNFYGCGTASDPIEIKNFPTIVPKIQANGPTEICSDQELTLIANLSDNLKWSNGESSKEIKINKSGNYFATARNEFGCEGKSEEINVKVKPAAIVPSVVNNGLEEFCQNDSTQLVVSSEDDFEWNIGKIDPILSVKTSGTYYALAKNSFGCFSKSNEINIKVNPTPEQPTITPNGPTIFCDDSTVVLSGPIASSYEWSNGLNQKEIQVNQSNSIFLKVTNEFGCVSPTSEMVEVLALPTPKNPNIIQTGTFTLTASFSGDTSGLNYIWKLNGEVLDNNKARLKAKLQGTYSVVGQQNFQISNNNSLTCSSIASQELNYVISEDNKGFSVYPNPNYVKEMKIETLEDVDNATVSIYDLTGKLYRTYFVTVFDDVKKFDLKGVPNGEFVIKIKNNRTKYFSKFLIR